MKILIKLDRFIAWLLFATMLLYFISGYGMTKGLIDATLATKLHISWLTYIILVAFTGHTSYAIHLALKRWQIWNIVAKMLLVVFYVIFLGFFVYIDRYYQPKTASSTTSSTVSQSTRSGDDNESDDDGSSVTVTNQNINSTNTTTTTKTFTISELAKYDGQNGNPSYVVVDGNVYDLTAVFRGGSHYSHFAGKELTNSFYIRHAKSALAKYPIVGTLAK